MEQLITPRLYVNPMIDVAFKYLFGTEKNKHLLKGLLEHVFSVDIEDICYDNTEQIGESVDARNAYFDVVCASPGAAMNSLWNARCVPRIISPNALCSTPPASSPDKPRKARGTMGSSRCTFWD